MKILIIGASGMLGQDLAGACRRGGHEILAPAHTELDITRAESLCDYVRRAAPEWVILSAAFTRVDDCETQRDLAFTVNAEGPRHVAQACKESGARLLFVSTDYVFNGGKPSPWTEDDPTDPLNVYGQSKLAGENFIKETFADYVIARTSWLYGLQGKNFVETILTKAATVPELKVVNDQQGSPTFTQDLAAGLLPLVEKEARGTFNVTNTGVCTWHEFAVTILQLTGLEAVTVLPVSSAQFNAPARRPANSVLSPERYRQFTGGQTLRPWREALADYLAVRKKDK